MPTIKKISLNGVPYDLGGGLTEDVKQASLQIAEKVAYIDEHGQDYYDELYTAFYDNMWNVTNTLSNAVNSNSATKTLKDGTYTAIISAATGYTLEGATVSVTMNGANITSSVYNNGTISIPSVTGDVVITVVAVALTVVSISAVYTQSGTVYDTDSLDSLKADLVVTAMFNDSSTEVVPSADYTLSGTLTVGTSTVTVSYEGQTATFSVSVTQGLLHPLFDGTYNAKLANGTVCGSITATPGDNYTHIKIQYTNQVPQMGLAANFTEGLSGKDTDVLNNRPLWQTLPAGSVCKLIITNVTNSLPLTWAINFKQANSSSSAPYFGKGNGTHLQGYEIDVTTSESIDLSCLFIFIQASSIPSGTVLELDVAFVVDGSRWF